MDWNANWTARKPNEQVWMWLINNNDNHNNGVRKREERYDVLELRKNNRYRKK